MAARTPRLPVAFVCHGAGPMPVTQPALQGQLTQHLVDLGKQVQASKPKALLVVSAHWEVWAHFLSTWIKNIQKKYLRILKKC
jgi:aromatic ring-opening dioxygenase catalytic subunit (LigB family)